ncbi:MAG: YceI family protein [Paludibacter sp.]|nr:YceI family protein [Paludibacter sp.]
MKKFNSLILVLVLFTSLLHSQTTVKVDLLKNSWLAINGSTNVVGFRLIHNGEKLLGRSITMTASQNQNKIYLSQNQLAIQVNNFSSDNVMALRDFKKLIKSDTYPAIKVQLNYIETLPGNEKSAYSKGNASVNITITGVTHQYSIPVSSNTQNEYISVVGGKKINIRDFGLQPPVEMMGLIKVSEWISIDFRMVCKLTFKESNLAQNKID